jgi:pimeloyl-ACP methyl ester carboxylesterase
MQAAFCIEAVDEALAWHPHIIPECGHCVPMEQPEMLNSILREVIAAS